MTGLVACDAVKGVVVTYSCRLTEVVWFYRSRIIVLCTATMFTGMHYRHATDSTEI